MVKAKRNFPISNAEAGLTAAFWNQLPSPPVTADPGAAARAAAAAALGLSSSFSMALLEAAGCPGGDYLAMTPTAWTMSEVAAFMGVSERTIGNWKTAGMPGGENKGPYCLPTVLRWRRSQPQPEAWHFTGNHNLKRVEATGDLARAILRLVRFRLQRGVAAALTDFIAGVKTFIPPERIGDVEAWLELMLHKHLVDELHLDNEQIEATLIDCWELI